jgi:hypothetical protein
MKSSFAMAALVVGCTAGAAGAQAPSQQVSMEEMQARMREAATPGPHHRALARFIGTWDVQISMVMPGVPVQKSAATAEYAWLLPNRWASQRIKGKLMGLDYDSFTILGFDNYAKNHVAVTVSSLDTAMTMLRGLVVDPSSKVTALYGTLDEYTTGELHKPLKTVTRVVDDSRHVMEVWDLGIGDAGAKVLEFEFRRRR